MKVWLTIWTIICTVAVYGQSDVPLRLRKNLRDRLDDFVFELQLYGRMSNGEERNAYRSLFDQNAIVFDYITPNYLTRNVGQELNKPVDQFMQDVERDFPQGFWQSAVIDTDLGAAINYATVDWESPSVSVRVALAVMGEYVDGGQFSNRPVMDFEVSFDTLSQRVVNFRVTRVSKVSSSLRYQKEERVPRFEKQIISSGFNSWNIATTEQTNGDFLIDNLSVNPDLSYGVSFNLVKLIAAPEPEEFSYSIGFGYMISNYSISIDNYFYSFLTTDQENDAVYQNVAGTELVESVSSELFEIPLRFRYERKLNRVFALYANLGISVTYLLKSAYDGSGVFTYSGYYPKYNLLVTDVEEYGFVSDRPESNDFKTNVSGFEREHLGITGLADLGINIEAKNGLVFYLGVSAFKSIVETQRIMNFQLISSQFGEFNGLLPVVNSINFGGYGFQLGIRKRFRSRNGLVKMETVINGQ
jgi:hypothetical protein